MNGSGSLLTPRYVASLQRSNFNNRALAAICRVDSKGAGIKGSPDSSKFTSPSHRLAVAHRATRTGKL
jgi:hypothetical protein